MQTVQSIRKYAQANPDIGRDYWPETECDQDDMGRFFMASPLVTVNVNGDIFDGAIICDGPHGPYYVIRDGFTFFVCN